MELEIHQTEEGGKSVITVRGEVDLYSSPRLRDAVTKAAAKGNGDIHVDLKGVPYMDSSGVATLVEGFRAANDKKKQFVLLAPSQAVLKVLQLSRLDSVFVIREDA
ncbi:MAG: STAS domain-containing protein [Candidatus Hydrogenedentes bacterium]|nr:STAS domain-containing protein [Candidatus Hydrogenedentota bacterium]